MIFDSALFTAYKDAMHTDPARGNRRGFPIDACHPGQALDQASRWLAEGADSLLVQPGDGVGGCPGPAAGAGERAAHQLLRLW